MPLYTWRDTVSGETVDVLRAFRDYELPPEGDEIPETLRDRECKWERIIGEKISVTKGNGWGSGKGSW